MNTYEIGDTITISAIFRDTAGNLADAPTAVIKFMTPASAVTTYTHPTDPNIVRVGTGQYYCTAWIPTGSASAAGLWRYYIFGYPSVKQATGGQFQVSRSPFWTG